MKTELMLVGFATLLCILSATIMFVEDEFAAMAASVVVTFGCAELTYKTIKNDL